jgi:hypothetical protein
MKNPCLLNRKLALFFSNIPMQKSYISQLSSFLSDLGKNISLEVGLD